jgi:hypothetical protein
MHLANAVAAKALTQVNAQDASAAPDDNGPASGQFFLRLTDSIRKNMALQARLVGRPKPASRAKTAAAPAPAEPVTPSVAEPATTQPIAVQPVAQPEPPKPAAPRTNNQQEYMASTSLMQRLNPSAYRLATRT